MFYFFSALLFSKVFAIIYDLLITNFPDEYVACKLHHAKISARPATILRFF